MGYNVAYLPLSKLQGAHLNPVDLLCYVVLEIPLPLVTSDGF
jgi:hypothetical protein